MPRKSTQNAVRRALARKLGRLKAEELALSLGYKWQAYPARKDGGWNGYPRGVWKHPKTGHLHTAQVIAIDQKPLDPNGKPFATAASLSELNRLEKLERKTAAELETSAIEREKEQQRRRRREAMLLA